MRSQAIWHPPALAVYIRQELRFTGGVHGGALRCAGTGAYAIYLNGALVGRGLGPDVAQAVVWERFDLGPSLQEGENTLLVFAVGRGAGDWFRAEGEIIQADGTRRELHTGSPWQVQAVEMWQAMDAGPLNCAYVAALEPESWAGGHFREAEWREATVVEGAEPRDWSPLAAVENEVWAREVVAFGEVDSANSIEFVAEPGAMKTAKCVRRESLLQGGKIDALVQARDEGRAAYLVLDFGRVVSGFPRLRLRGHEGVVVDMGFARQWGTVESGVRYVCRGGLQEWTFPQLEACRYVVLRVGQCPQEMGFDSVSLIERSVEVEARSSFETVGDGWERIRGTGVRSLAACRQEVYGLASGEQEYDWRKFYVLALNDFYITGCGASDTTRAVLVSSRPPEGGAQAFFYALFVELVYRHTGDGELVARYLPAVLNGLEAAGDEGQSTADTALRAAAWQAAEALCRSAGEGKRAIECERVFHRARKGVQVAWSEARGVFADATGSEDCGLWTNALVLYCGLAEAGQRVRVAQALHAGELGCADDLWHAFFVAGALWRAGEGEWALAYVQEEWGSLLEREGRTWAEKAESLAVQPGPDALLATHVLGAAIGRDGILEIRPQLSGLERAEGKVPTARGDIELAWGAYGGDFSLRLELPDDSETHLAIPRRERRFPTIAINGETVWRNEKVHPNFLAQEFISEDAHVVLVLRKAGEYEVVMQ